MPSTPGSSNAQSRLNMVMVVVAQDTQACVSLSPTTKRWVSVKVRVRVRVKVSVRIRVRTRRPGHCVGLGRVRVRITVGLAGCVMGLE